MYTCVGGIPDVGWCLYAGVTVPPWCSGAGVGLIPILSSMARSCGVVILGLMAVVLVEWINKCYGLEGGARDNLPFCYGIKLISGCTQYIVGVWDLCRIFICDHDYSVSFLLAVSLEY